MFTRFVRTTGLTGALLAIATIAQSQTKMAPKVPYSPTPAISTTSVPTATTLKWKADGGLSYTIMLGLSPTPPVVGVTGLSAAYVPPGLQPGKKYYWQVVATNWFGSVRGPLWSFTTAGAASSPPTTTASAPAATPINCVLSSWVLSSATSWSACSSTGQQSRTETWIRTILATPLNGGLACGALTEARTATQTCTPTTSAPPAPPTGTAPPANTTGLLVQSQLVYEGAFRVPVGAGDTTFEYGGTALTYHPGHNSLMMVGHDWYQKVGEISIPAPVQASSVANLPRAALLQAPTDVLKGKIGTIDGDTYNGVKVGGIVPFGSSLAVSAWSFYDAGPNKQTKTHFVTGQNFSAISTVTGPFQVGVGFQDMVPTDTSRIGGFVSGYMAAIPNAWQSALGGTHLTGQGGGISILNRTSSGPSATVFSATEIGVPNAPTKLVMGYPSESSMPSSPLHKPMLGTWGQNGGLYNGMQYFRGMVFPEGTRSVLFFGWGASEFCYGANTSDPAMHRQPVPNQGSQIYCYDPVPGNEWTGPHGYPNRSLVFAYDANDFLAVKNGTKKPWDVKPYATWYFSLPFQQKLVNGIDTGTYEIVGAAYDPASKRIFLTASRGDGAAPLIHVLRHP